MADGFGAITWWGFSPAIDLQDECKYIVSYTTFNWSRWRITDLFLTFIYPRPVGFRWRKGFSSD